MPTFSFQALKISALKQCLRANGQLLSGNKDELVERVEERFANGALGRCTDCGYCCPPPCHPVHRPCPLMPPLRFRGRSDRDCPSRSGGNYHRVGNGPRWECKGYYDGDSFVRCGSSTTEPPRATFAIPAEIRTALAIPMGPSEVASAGPSMVD